MTGLYGLPRHGRFATHVNVGRMEAGSARNVIPDRATLEIEIRGGQEEALEHMERRARRIVEGAAIAHGCELLIDEMGRTIGAHSTPRMAERISVVAGSLPDVEQVFDEWPLGGGDDAAFFMRRVQENGGEAAYLILGSDLAAGHHATNFDFTERDIGLGVRLMAGILEKITEGGALGRAPASIQQ